MATGGLPTASVCSSPVSTSRGVDRWTIASLLEPWTEPSVRAVPRSGTTNATVDLEVRGLDGTIIAVDWNPHGDWEYLVDAAWHDHDRATLVVQTRDQRCCAVLDVDPTTGAVAERYRWIDEHWIDIVVGAPVWVGHRLVTVEDRGPARRLVVDGEAAHRRRAPDPPGGVRRRDRRDRDGLHRRRPA